ncbi:MAG: TIGR04283 family arsenosugar biosynthesis glycosyltransferase [Acetobacteraceae bacterium]|nr:TIGR04283 family arsenosugar biosynthesis glycosyltransferase [Acetobacteraceae bacterium]
MLTIIVPTLNAAHALPRTLAACAEMHALEHIVVDGGSIDETRVLAMRLGARVITVPPGRGTQLAAGAAAARGDWLLFLHADSCPAPGWAAVARARMADPARAHYFRFALDDPAPQARRLERLVAWRCRTLALPYGDQGLLIARTLYDDVGGYRPLPLMEDVDLVRRLGRRRLEALPVPVITSAERWRRDGWTGRSARNLVCLALWFLGVPPRAIRRLYG